MNKFLSTKHETNKNVKINFDKPPRKPQQEAKSRGKTPEEQTKTRGKTPEEHTFYKPNTFYVNAQKIYINLNDNSKKEDLILQSKPKPNLQNKHSLIINNLNYPCDNKKLNVSSHTTKHKRHFTDNLQIDPDLTYINITQDYNEVINPIHS